MQIKTTMRYHLTSIRTANISKSEKQVLVRMWKKGNPHALLVGMQIGAATVENSVEVPQKLNIGIALWPSNPTSGYLAKEIQNLI